MSVEIFQSCPLIASCVFIVSAIWFIKLCFPNRNAQLLDKFPAPYRLPLIDHAWMANTHYDDIVKMAFSFWKTYGERYRLKFGPHNFILLAKPDDAEKLLTSSINIEKGQTYSFLLPWLGEGLLTSKGCVYIF
ncbi:unnamed protein product [Allacma fusca]|uniref:Cytochrome P450 n=1 Tax=Allacma fusca TaxID=39272 RepID=A0A8J2KSM1_9HEXA|nr:unnamed protein product [Allacma fusca]